MKKAGGNIGRNVVEITIKMKIVVRKPWMIEVYTRSVQKVLSLLLLLIKEEKKIFFLSNIYIGKAYGKVRGIRQIKKSGWS